MPAVSRRKCCIPCASVKRSCDKQVPECQRCRDRDIDCNYPLPKRSRKGRDPLWVDDVVEKQGVTLSQDPPFTYPTTMGGSNGMDDGIYNNTAELNFAYGWEAVIHDNPEYNAALADGMPFPYISTSLPPPTTAVSEPPRQSSPIPPRPSAAATITSSTQPPVCENISLDKPSCPWFLHKETWTLKHCDETPSCSALLELEPFISNVKAMLQDWVHTGHNSFIHHRLYAKGMSTCLQDAFTTLASYMTAHTPTVKHIILRIAEERSARLVNQREENNGWNGVASGYHGGSVAQEGILVQLAHVQALFVYEFIRLFDGDICVRASAEQHLPILRRWTTDLRETIQQYRGDDSSTSPYHSGGPWHEQTQTQSDIDYAKAMDTWHLWILAESVRRSHLVVDAVANIYQTLTKGWAECAGAVMFTVRAGLWTAETAMQWCRFSVVGTSPLLVPSLSPGPIMERYKADEVDAFAKVYWTFIVGRERVKWWVEQSGIEGIVG